MTESGRRTSVGLHPITPPANMRRETTFVNKPSPDEIVDPNRAPRNLILCFDGTGNQYKGDGTETNILKMFGMLNRDAAHQYHYYQPGIGTYAVRSALGNTDWLTRQRCEIEKGLDLMLGTSLSEHVLGGYKFLMRYYSPGDKVYIFGFSRGAYTARFLAEMLDDVGLLPHGNEEMVQFAWEVFTQWQCRKPFETRPADNKEEQAKLESWFNPVGRKYRRDRKNYETARKLGAKLKGFREHFSRHMDPIRFLGLFDTVNSVPEYENAWLGRAGAGKKVFPYSARSSAREIWHAVSIDERRVKFRPDLVYQAIPVESKDPCHFAGNNVRERAAIAELEHRARCVAADHDSPVASRAVASPHSPLSPEKMEKLLHDTTEFGQTVHEVWFAGNHCDVGGGWADPDNGGLNMADVPLVWMIRAARKAGVLFDEKSFGKLREAILGPDALKTVTATVTSTTTPATNGVTTVTATKTTVETKAVTKPGVNEMTLHQRYQSMLTNTHHDVLKLERLKYLWMEYLPFKRMDLNPKTKEWRPMRWPPSRGDTRDVPDEVPIKVHGSVIERMKANPAYNPRNLLLGGGRGGHPPLFGRPRPPVPFNPDHWVPIRDEPHLTALGDDVFGCVYRKLTIEEIAKLEKNKVAVKETEILGEKNGTAEKTTAVVDTDY
ncbi:Uncharacterized alpha/beta hydrolase domain (DUF2235) domain containing protein [Naviculisporaceae sp. PSN 640]